MIKIYFAGKEIPVPDVIYRDNINSPNNSINESPVNINLPNTIKNAISITIFDKPVKATNCIITKVSECICSSKDLFWYGCKCFYSQRNKQ